MRLWLIKSLTIIILILLVILIPGCQKKQNHPPDTPYTPIGPSNGFTDRYYGFTSVIIDPDDDNVAIRFDWGNGDTSVWSQLRASNDYVEIHFSWSGPGSYSLKAQAKDEYENISEWSLPHNIMITINQPPNTPSTPSGPSIGFIDTFYLFSSSAIDPDEETVSIRFDWGDGDTSEWSNPVPSRGPVLRAHSWSYPDTFYIKAQAKGIVEEITGWSEAHQIIINSESVSKIEKLKNQNNLVKYK